MVVSLSSKTLAAILSMFWMLLAAFQFFLRVMCWVVWHLSVYESVSLSILHILPSSSHRQVPSKVRSALEHNSV